MKYITLIIGLLVMGCGKQEQTDTEKPVKELTLREKVVGEYEMKKGEDTDKAVFLANGTMEAYTNGKRVYVCKWNVANGELHFINEAGGIGVFRINKDGSLTVIAEIDKDGERIDIPKEEQLTFKKIK
jgi:hypothetical protein